MRQELTDADRYTEECPGRLQFRFAEPRGDHAGGPEPYRPQDIELWDLETGEQVLTALDITCRWDPEHWLRVQTQVFADADGRPILGGDTRPALDQDGKVRTVTVHWALADACRREPRTPTEGTT